MLAGQFTGTTSLPEARNAPHQLALELAPAKGELVGQLTTVEQNDKVVFMLPSFVRLRPATVPAR